MLCVLVAVMQEVQMYRVVVASIAVVSCIASATPGIAQGTSAPAQAMRKLLDMSAKPTLSSERIVRVQEALQDKGFDPGPIDGVLGPMTREAVRGYQDRFGMPATGEIDNQTLYALGGTELAGGLGNNDH
jgi:peptidoglycan hydrolase-like protein with peptidoglycan-binding domain